MKFNVTIGSHPDQIDLTMDGKGGLSGVISHTEFGDGQIGEGVQTGNDLAGKVAIDGKTATSRPR